MANNTTLDPGTGGDTIATDDVAGTKYQRVKLTDGTEDSATAILAGGGVEAGALRVTVASDSTGVLSVDDNGGSLTVDAASLPLPTGASTAVKQPALGTAGTASADVITVQGIASMTALKVDGSAVTQPVSGTVTATGPLTDTQLRATPVPVSGTVTANLGTAAVTNAGTFASQESGAALTALQVIDNPVVVDDAAFTIATTSVNMAGFLADQTATDSVNEGDAGAARMTLDRKQIVTISPSADTEGLDVGPGTGAKQISAASTNATSVKASAGKVFGWYLYNDGALEAYLKVYNKASAPTVGTDVPVLVIAIPAGAAANVEFTQGIAFATGIATALTTGFADADSGAVAAGQVIVNLFYK